MTWRDKDWRYANAAETAKPGYLARRFKAIQREIDAKKEAQALKVTPIKKVRK